MSQERYIQYIDNIYNNLDLISSRNAYAINNIRGETYYLFQDAGQDFINPFCCTVYALDIKDSSLLDDVLFIILLGVIGQIYHYNNFDQDLLTYLKQQDLPQTKSLLIALIKADIIEADKGNEIDTPAESNTNYCDFAEQSFYVETLYNYDNAVVWY